MSNNSPNRVKREVEDVPYDPVFASDDEDALLDEVVCGTAFQKTQSEINDKNINAASPKVMPKNESHVAPKIEPKTEIEESPPVTMEMNEREEKVVKMEENDKDTMETVHWDEEEDSAEEEESYRDTRRNPIFQEDQATVRKRLREESLEKRSERVSRNRRNSGSSSSTTSSGAGKKRPDFEGDPAVLARRQKDIDYGKNTIGYDRYTRMIPKDQRTREHPKTPPKYTNYSRRGWDGMVRLWRKQLHQWDPPEENGTKDIENPTSA